MFRRPYNESIFDLRHSYKKVFPEAEFDDLTNDDGSIKDQIDSSKIFKIKYTINLLPQIGTHLEVTEEDGVLNSVLMNGETNFMRIISLSDELDIFNALSLCDLIEFKWNQFGMRHHLVGCMMHMIQIVILIIYVDYIYINNNLCEAKKPTNEEEPVVCKDNPYALVLLGGIVYPFIYECLQIYKMGPVQYFSNAKNLFDQLYIWGSIMMSVFHMILAPIHIVSKVIMIVVIMLSIHRTFKFMRIFSSFSPIVTMLQQVVQDLQQFMLFYTILIFLFSILWCAIGLGNKN